ncbi:MAG: hypothetical protein C3F13_07175 [Anaerolineales bacterium]|nr:MAG: hypothetical protein C3F13_07175 [Anaerolineales bacterium]
MAKQTSKEQLLKDIHIERRRLEKRLATLRKEEMILPGVTGTWSVKDILAHLSAWERLFLDWCSTGLNGLMPEISPVGMKRKTIDALNQQIFKQNQGRDLADVFTEFYASYQEVMTVIGSIPEEDMFTRSRFTWTGPLILADYIAGNTCNHYAWANAQIKKYVKKASEDLGKNMQID